MPTSLSPLTPAPPALSQADQDALTDLYVRGKPANTLRAYERDRLHLAVWEQTAFDAALDWTEREDVALRFILDHNHD